MTRYLLTFVNAQQINNEKIADWHRLSVQTENPGKI